MSARSAGACDPVLGEEADAKPKAEQADGEGRAIGQGDRAQEVERRLLPRTRREIVATLWPGAPEADAIAELDAALAHLARLALLVR